MINEQDVKTLKTLIDVLQPIRNKSDKLAGESYVTASAILPVIIMIKAKINKCDADDVVNENNDIDVNLKKKKRLKVVIDLINSRYTNNNILKLSTALDSRLKFHHIQFGLADIRKVKTTIKDGMVV